MGQIIFLNPFGNDEITGGIKTTYVHADLLRELGFKVVVLQPAGPPTWLNEQLQSLAVREASANAEDILVFPEIHLGSLADLAKKEVSARKVMFCQNQYYMFFYGITAEEYARFGFTKFIASSHFAKRCIESVLHLRDVAFVPCHIERDLFFPREKQMQIVTMPRKFPFVGGLPGQATLMKKMLGLKYPHLRDVPWALFENEPQHKVAETMGQSTIFLSLSRLESLGLGPLEAMASGCIVVGYHGTGGLEYATPENGLWFSPEQIEELVDALAGVIEGLGRGDVNLRKIIEGGIATASRFSKEETKQALQKVFGDLLLTAAKAKLSAGDETASPSHSPAMGGTASAELNDHVHPLSLNSTGEVEEAIAIPSSLPQPEGSSEEGPDAVTSLIGRAGVLLDLARFEDALALCEEVLAVRRNDFNILNLRGLALEHLHRFEEALASYDQAINIAPRSSEAHYNRGNVLADLGRLDEALASYDQALAIRQDAGPDVAPILNNRGLVLEELGRFDDALQSYQRALQIRPDYAAAGENRKLLVARLESSHSSPPQRLATY